MIWCLPVGVNRLLSWGWLRVLSPRAVPFIISRCSWINSVNNYKSESWEGSHSLLKTLDFEGVGVRKMMRWHFVVQLCRSSSKRLASRVCWRRRMNFDAFAVHVMKFLFLIESGVTPKANTICWFQTGLENVGIRVLLNIKCNNFGLFPFWGWSKWLRL